QIVRALRIGGNLSDAIERIAEDLTFEQLVRVREFSEKLNLVGIVFMFVGIVFPTLLAILNGIGNAPLGTNLLAGFAMPLSTLITIYLIGIPLFMLVILLFVKRADPLGE
ncbi:MAG: type II secretion system F family protein, partial [Candidatus Diapherotrites archaeon]|nr:type II secretion system F family protein [Candidatus Diapherotrites archaeon]